MFYLYRKTSVTNTRVTNLTGQLHTPFGAGAFFTSYPISSKRSSIHKERITECPSDARFVWKKNGQKMEVCVSEQSHALADGRVHILSWVKDAVAENSEYHCSVLSKAGNKTSKVLITVEGKDNTGQAGWIKEYDLWRSAVSEHDTMMQNWKMTWESCNKKDAP